MQVAELRQAGLIFTALLGLGFMLLACNDGDSKSAPASEGPSEVRGQGWLMEPITPEELKEVGGDPPRDGEIDPCSLVTRAEVEEILQDSLVDVYRHSSPTVLCEYFNDGEPFGSATIRLDTAVSEAEVQKEIEIGEQLGGSRAREVLGLGDAAFALGPLLYVYEGDTLLLVTVIVEERPDLEAAKELALKALTRLRSE